MLYNLYTGCPNKHGNSVTNWISSLLWISIVIPDFKPIILLWVFIFSARVYFMKTVNGCKDVSIMSPQDEQFILFVYFNFLVLQSTTVCSQNINKQNVNIADETYTDYSFLSRYHYTKSWNYLKRRYQIRHWIPMFIGTPCTNCLSPQAHCLNDHFFLKYLFWLLTHFQLSYFDNF